MPGPDSPAVAPRTAGQRAARLAEAINAWEPVLHGHIAAANGTDATWPGVSHALLVRARQALEHGRVSEGWTCLQEAQRHALAALEPDERRAHAATVLHEAASGKLSAWRRASVESLLAAAAEDPPREVSLPDLDEAVRILHEQYANTYQRLTIVQRQLLISGIVVSALIALVLLLAWYNFFDDVAALRHLAVATTAGALGGAGSAIIATARSSVDKRIPEYLNWGPMMLIRPVFGAGAAIAVYFFMRGGVLPGAVETTWTLAATSFVAGFSERWFLGVVGAMEGRNGQGERG
jgi:hypothetical protein